MVVLIDSNIYIGLIRQQKDVRFVLREWIGSGDLLSCGVILAKVIRGVRSLKIRNDLMDMFDVLPEVSIDSKLWRDTTDLAWQLDRRGIVLPLVDLVIAACALSAYATLISEDTHFAHVPHLKVRKDLPRYS